MTFISIFRVVAMSFSLLLGLTVLGLTAHWTWGTLEGAFLFDFEIVALVVGSLSALFLPLMLIIGWVRRGAVTTMIAVELPILTILWILFLVTGALTAQWSGVLYPVGCSGLFPVTAAWCQEFFAIESSAFVAWITLFLYTVTLLCYTLVAQSRGNGVWKKGVSGTVFFVKPTQPPPVTAFTAQNPNFYAPAQMSQYPPGTVPMMQAGAATQHYPGGVPSHTGLPQV